MTDGGSGLATALKTCWPDTLVRDVAHEAVGLRVDALAEHLDGLDDEAGLFSGLTHSGLPNVSPGSTAPAGNCHESEHFEDRRVDDESLSRARADSPGLNHHDDAPEHPGRGRRLLRNDETPSDRKHLLWSNGVSPGGGARGIRTPDLLIANETRYQLRHSPLSGSNISSRP